MSEGLALPAVDRRPITVVGRSWMDVAFMTRSIIIAKLAFPLWSSRACIARIPIGVAALPTPNILAEMFKAIIFCVSSLSTLNIFLIRGRRSFASFWDKPLASTSSIKPSHTTYTAQSSIQSSKALVEAPIISFNISAGFVIKSTRIDDSIIIIQKIFILIFMRDIWIKVIFLTEKIIFDKL